MKPKQKNEIDFTKLIKLCQEYLDFVDNDEEYHEDGAHNDYIFESAVEAVFGEDVFDWINDRQD